MLWPVRFCSLSLIALGGYFLFDVDFDIPMSTAHRNAAPFCMAGRTQTTGPAAALAPWRDHTWCGCSVGQPAVDDHGHWWRPGLQSHAGAGDAGWNRSHGSLRHMSWLPLKVLEHCGPRCPCSFLQVPLSAYIFICSLSRFIWLVLGCFGHSAIFPPPGPFWGLFVHAIFGGSGGWTVFPVPSIFPGVQLNCWTHVIVGLPVCRMARCTLCAALPGDPPGAIFNVGGDRNTMAVGAEKSGLEFWAGILGRSFGPEL